MKKTVRYFLLLPFSILYGIIISIRNWLYDIEILPSKEKNTAIISVGNLTVGGTGKTPHVEYIISELNSLFRVAVLSRGYKRKTKGFILAHESSNANQIGDEPYQIYNKFQSIPVAVCEDRNEGVDKLLKAHENLDLIILDDAFQHRKIRSGLSILLTDYNRLHTRDSMLPGGNLREPVKGSRRSDIIIVTKCSTDIKPIDMRIVEHEIKPSIYHPIYFSSYIYDEPLPLFLRYADKHWLFKKIKEKKASIVLVTGIANPKMIVEFLNDFTDDLKSIHFKDHHVFTKKNITQIENEFYKIQNTEKLILMTEKDGTRLINNNQLPDSLKYHIFVLPIRVKILNDKETSLIKRITDYVTENSGNRKISQRYN